LTLLKRSPQNRNEIMEEAPVVREEQGPVSVLTMQYRPYNLLDPTLLGASQINGCHFKEGEMVMLSLPAANRDPAMFPDAGRVVIDRSPNRHAALGLGIHRCIGLHLARIEITVALQEWLAKIPDFAMAPDTKVKWSAGPVRGPRTLPMVFGADQPVLQSGC
jgi:hypothetical protein